MEAVHPSTTLVLALAAGVLAHLVARHLRVAAILVLLGAGAALGPDGLGWVQPRSLGQGLFAIVELAVAVILFEGGLNLEISRLRREQRPIRRLVSLGAGVTLAGGALCARAALDWPWMQAVLFGSLVVVTGPTVIGPLLSELRLRPRVATVLEAEGVLIDPIGAILAVLLLEVALAPEGGAFAGGALGLLLRLASGIGLGLTGGLLIAGALRLRRLVAEGYENIFTLAAVLVLFQLSDQLISQSGILAVTVAGVVVGNIPTRVQRDLREFKDQLSVLLIGLLFVLLAADVRVSDVRALGWPGLGVVAGLVLGVRPLGVWLSTLGSDLSARERLLVAWIAPRGIVAAAVASLTATALERNGLAGGPELRALVFLTITGTVLLAGLTAGPVATLLGVRLPARDGVAILGVHGLSLALGELLHKAGRRVIFLDSNPQSCRRAEEAGFGVVYGNALEERTLQRARLDGVGTAIGMTANETLNGLFAARVHELFRVPEVLVALASATSGVTAEIARSQNSAPVFEAPHDVERWDVRARHGDLVVVRRCFAPSEPRSEADADASEESADARERFVILALERGPRLRPMSATLTPREGDVASIAIYAPEAAEAEARLLARGWQAEAPGSEPR